MKLADILMEQPQHQDQLEQVASRMVQWLQSLPADNFPFRVQGKDLPKGILGSSHARLRNMSWQFKVSDGNLDGEYWPLGDELTVSLQRVHDHVNWTNVESTIVHELRHKFDSSLSRKPKQMYGTKFVDRRNVPYLEKKHEINARYAQVIAVANAAFAANPQMTMLQYIQTFEKAAAKERLIDIFMAGDGEGNDFQAMSKSNKGSEEIFGRATPGLYNMIYGSSADKSRLQGPIENPQYRALITRAAKNYNYLVDRQKKQAKK